MRDFRAEIKRFTRDNKRIASQPSSIPFERIEFDMEKKRKIEARLFFIFETVDIRLVNLSKNIICSCNSSRENSRDGRRMMNRMDNIFPRVLMEYLSDGFSRVGKQNNVPIYLRTD